MELRSDVERTLLSVDVAFEVGGWTTLREKYSAGAGLSLNVDRNNWGCAASRAFREVASTALAGESTWCGDGAHRPMVMRTNGGYLYIRLANVCWPGCDVHGYGDVDLWRDSGRRTSDLLQRND